MRTGARLNVLAFSILAFLVLGPRPADTARRALEGTVHQLLDSDVRPFAIGHRGSGENSGDDPSRPIENTVPAVRKGFLAGVSVVEVDVQITKDGEVAVSHVDFLPDFTCLNTLTLSELQARKPHVPSLQAVLNQARKFNQSPELPGGLPRGLVIVELKPASPLCDPDDTQEKAIVAAAVQVIRRKGMTNQVMVTSLSPALLFLAAEEAPEIARILAISGVQFLTPEQVEDQLGFPVTVIDKDLDLGLQWAEVGTLFRLPGYRSSEEVFTTVAVTRARVVEADLFFLSSEDAPLVVDALHAFGLKVFGFTADDADEWFFLQSLGVDAIYTNDVPLGVKLQAPIP